MSGISTGVGLISGINTAQLIEQLMALEARPVDALRARIGQLDARKTAFLELSARLLAIKNSSGRFKSTAFFDVFSSASSNPEALTASAGSGATPGTFTFRVRQLVTSAQLISRGFADADRTPVGAGTLSIELGKGRVNAGTDLSVLNGGQGVRRGAIQITDRSGATADVDLSFALTLDDVVGAINSADGVRVRARVTGLDENGASGDRLVIEDLTGKTTSDLVVESVRGGFTAEDLGVAGRAAGARLDGSALLELSDTTQLSFLNDGNGMGRLANGSLTDDLIFEMAGGEGTFGVSLADFLEGETKLAAMNGGHGVRLGKVRITTRDGRNAEVDLVGARTTQDVLDRLNNSGLPVRAQIVQSHLVIADDTTGKGDPPPTLKIEDVSGFAAADLGIVGESDTGTISGRNVYGVRTLGDVVRAINLADGNDGSVTARIEGKNLVLETSGLDVSVTVKAGSREDGSISTAARDLGIENAEVNFGSAFVSRDLIGGLSTVMLSSLNGGDGVAVGQTTFTNRQGQSATVDFTSAKTLQDIVDIINRDLGALAMGASISPTGNGIRISDTSGGSGEIRISDDIGATADDLGLLVGGDSGRNVSGNVVDGGNLQLRYIAEGTLLSSLNQGRGAAFGEFSVTAADGKSFRVTLSSNATDNVGQVIDRINAAAKQAGVDVKARINDTGDGLQLDDASTGTGKLTVREEGGTTAADLNLLGSAKSGESFINGTYETRIDIAAGDSLSAIRDKINAAGADVTATVINTGGGGLPYTLTLSSKVTGRAGDLIVDSGGLELGLETLIRAQDAILTYGSDDNSAGVLISSSSNTLDNVVPGITLNLLDVSDEPITVTVAQDVDKIVEAVKKFVEDVNAAQSSMTASTRFNSDTLAKGILFGDSTVDNVRGRLTNVFFSRFEPGGDQFGSLSSVGLSIGSNHTLEFDEEKFREAYAQSPEQIEALFTDEKGGIGVAMEETLDALTGESGIIPGKTELLDGQKELMNDRIAALSKLLDGKRARLERQFAGLESALARLQGNQTALAQLQALAAAAR